MTNPTFTTWHKSSHSSGGDNCVEVAFAPDGAVGIRDSKNPGGPVLAFTSSEWKAFRGGIQDGEFNS